MTFQVGGRQSTGITFGIIMMQEGLQGSCTRKVRQILHVQGVGHLDSRNVIDRKINIRGEIEITRIDRELIRASSHDLQTQREEVGFGPDSFP
jgi:hypothetical protein